MASLEEAKGKFEAKLNEISPKKARKIIYEISQKFKDQDATCIYDWDQYFMSIACLAALASEDPSSPVGACIVSPNKTVVGVGYNSMPELPSDATVITGTTTTGTTTAGTTTTGTITTGTTTTGTTTTGTTTMSTTTTDIPTTSMPNTDDFEFPWKGRESDKFEESHYDTKRKFLYVVHAVVNAIINKTIPSLEGCTIYTTMPPDTDCAHAIIHSGITVVKYAKFYNKENGTGNNEPNERTEQGDIKKARELLRQSDVLLIKYDMKKKTGQGKEITIKEPKVTIKGESISLWERISREKTEEEKNKKEEKYKLKLPDLFKSIALLSAKKQGYQSSSASFTQGACIVDKTKKILSVGQSGYPEIVNDKAIQRDTDEASSVQNDFIAHAEYKAVLARGAPSFKGCTLYVTKYPCNGCAQVIVQSGITTVCYNEKGTEGDPFTYDQLDSTNEEEWSEKAEKNMYWASKKILLQNKIKLEPWKKDEIKVEVHKAK